MIVSWGFRIAFWGLKVVVAFITCLASIKHALTFAADVTLLSALVVVVDVGLREEKRMAEKEERKSKCFQITITENMTTKASSQKWPQHMNITQYKLWSIDI